MLQLKEKEIDKFIAHSEQKYLDDIENICKVENLNQKKDELKKLISMIFLAGFDSGVKTASKILKLTVESICENPE
jgi:hypothetical protein